ncbi:hypothetical protein DSO57_1009814 [Entomophthora muscae]|uniref:Uncharacterized protein n=1 Tax=Entomophthora muscae TaxID=34485 RepID=A0ACC2RXV4_9FUNG|nr:hypothetical protein DSO57_1009814 [Entomophthora muscae]
MTVHYYKFMEVMPILVLGFLTCCLIVLLHMCLMVLPIVDSQPTEAPAPTSVVLPPSASLPMISYTDPPPLSNSGLPRIFVISGVMSTKCGLDCSKTIVLILVFLTQPA